MKLKRFLLTITLLFISFYQNGFSNPIEIQYWHGHTGKLENIINQIAQKWNSSQRNSILIPTSKGTYEDILATTIAAYKADKHPHLVQVYDAGASIMISQVKNGVVLPYEDMAKKYSMNFNKEDYVPRIRNFYADVNGKMIGVPFNSSTCLMYANMEILEQVGVNTVPKTYEDFELVAQKIKDEGFIPLLQSHSPWIWVENFFSRHNLLMTNNNNGYEDYPTKTFFSNTSEFIFHWKKVKEWKDKGWYKYLGRSWADNQAPFISGEAAFWLGSASSFSEMKNIVPNFTVNHIPYWKSITNGIEYPTFIGGAANWILSGKSNEEYEELMKIIDFMNSAELQLFYHNLSGYAATTYSAIELAENIGFYQLSPFHKAVGEQLNLKNSTIPGGYRAGNWPQIRELIYENVHNMLNDKISVKEGWKKTDDGASKLLKQFMKTQN